MQTTLSKPVNRTVKYLLAGTVVLGIILRIAVWLQNRDLIIDEANIARNLFERDFAGLLLPLDYEQYAPPGFLWFIKFCSLLFGFSEWSLKLYSLITGICSVIVFLFLLKELLPTRSVWYALFLFATMHIMLRYSSEVKQYMGDVLVVLSLLLLALKVKISEWRGARFVLVWIAVGTVAIWSSMPSVFALAGVGLYYFALAYKDRNHNFIAVLALCAGVWLVEFGAYYWLLLRPQANSSYLQTFHHYYFLVATPENMKDWLLNWVNISALFRTFGNNDPFPLNLVFNVLLLLAGAFFMVRKHFPKALLILVPIIAMLTASALKQYSLLPRVSLFVIPLLLLTISFGAEQVFRLSSKFPSYVLVLFLVLYAWNGQRISMLWRPYKAEQLTDGLAIMKEHHIPARDLLIHHASVPALVYYTSIHPDKAKWQFAIGADTLLWSTNYDSLAHVIKHVWKLDRPFGFVATNVTEAAARKQYQAFGKHFRTLYRFDEDYLRAYIFKDE